MSASDSGSRCRSTSAMVPSAWVPGASPQASSICGQVSRASSEAISARSGISIWLTCLGSTGQTCMSAR